MRVHRRADRHPRDTALTLTTWIDVIYDDPVRVALLQTAGLLLGGWLLLAGIRLPPPRGVEKVAGHWVYVDPLHLYEAYREQVTVTPIDDVVEANFTHNYNNGSYQNSVIRRSSGRQLGPASDAQERGAGRADGRLPELPRLGSRPRAATARRFPRRASAGWPSTSPRTTPNRRTPEGNINLNLVELDITEVPEEPAREGRGHAGVPARTS